MAQSQFQPFLSHHSCLSHLSASSAWHCAWHTSTGKKLLLPPFLFGMELVRQIKLP